MTSYPSPDVPVREFNTRFGVPLPPAEAAPTLDFARAPLRMALVEEEFVELIAAYYGSKGGEHVQAALTYARESLDEQNRDLVEVCDALGDMTVVIYGMAQEASVPLDALITEIHQSNMSKLGLDGNPILRESDNKILKGPNYFAPDVAGVLRIHGLQD